MTVKWYDAKKNTPHLGEVNEYNLRESEPVLVYGRDRAGIGYAFSVAQYMYDEGDKTGDWYDAYDYEQYEMSEVIAWTPLPETPKMAEEKR